MTIEKYLQFEIAPSKEKIYPSKLLKFFSQEDELKFEINISDEVIVFTQSDRIIISGEKTYWFTGRIGGIITKSNSDLDAKYDGKDNIIINANIKSWKAIFVRDKCYLELETNDNNIFNSVRIPNTEMDKLMHLQNELNSLTKAGH